MNEKWDGFDQVANRMNSRKKEKSEFYETYNEAVVNYMPKHQRQFCNSESYKFLCKQLKKFLEEDFSKENQQALKLAKDNFEHFCSFEGKG